MVQPEVVESESKRSSVERMGDRLKCFQRSVADADDVDSGVIQKALRNNSDRICEIYDRSARSHAFNQPCIFQHHTQIAHGACEATCAHSFLADEPMCQSYRFIFHPRVDSTDANAGDDIVRSFQRTLRLRVSREARAQSTSLAHSFRNPLNDLDALRIGIPKRKLVHSHIAAKACEAVDEEWAAHSCGSHQSDFHGGVMSSLAIFR